MNRLDDWLAPILEDRRASHRFRQQRVLRPLDAVHVEFEGREYVNFASNNYLGLTHHPRVIQGAADAMAQDGAGAGAASLVTGYGPSHARAEAAIARWKRTQTALLLPSGYQANQAAIQTLAHLPAQPRFLLDKLAHASLIHAVQASQCPFRVFPHNHMEKLRRLLEQADPDQPQVVVTESIFSMDGDAADLPGLAQLKRQHPFILLLDEAHAGGVYGPDGSGYAAELGLGDLADVTVVTCSKALGVMGGAICGSTPLRDAILNFAPAAIFSTHVPPMLCGAIQAALEVLHDEPQRQQRVRSLAQSMRSVLTQQGFVVPPGDSPIIPVILGGESAALQAAARLKERGFWIPAIRPPTVAPGSSRLRITLSCRHSDDEVASLIAALGELAESITKRRIPG